MSTPPRFTSGRSLELQPDPRGSNHSLTARAKRAFGGDRLGGRRIAQVTLTHRLLCLVGVVLATCLLGSQLPGLRIDPALDKTFPQDDARLDDYVSSRETFGADEDTALCVIEFPSSVLERDSMARIHELTEALKEERLVDEERIISLTQATFARVDNEGELDVGPLYEPSRYDQWDAAEIDRLLRDHPAFDQRLVSRDRRLAGFWIPLAPGDSSDATRKQFVHDLRRFFSAEGQLREDEVAHLEGFAVARDTILSMILEDTWRLFPFAFGALLVVLACLYRQLVAPALALSVIGISIVWTLGAMAWLDIPFSTLSACIPVMVLVASVGDVVHLLSHYHRRLGAGEGKEAALTHAVSHVAGPCLLTSVTTAAGFASLGLSQVEMLREFGIPVALGVMAAYLVTLGTLPSLLTWLPAPRVRTDRGVLAGLGAALDRFTSRRALAVVLATVALVAASLAALPSINRDTRLMEDLDPEEPLVHTRELLEARFGGAASVELVLDTGQVGGALRPDVQRSVLALTNALRGERFREQGVLSALSLPDFLSDAFNTWNQRDAATHGQLPDTAEALAQLHFLYWFGDQDPTVGLVETPSDPEQLRVRLRVGNLYTSEFFQLVEQIEDEAARRLPSDVKVTVTGTTYMARLVTQSLVGEMLQSALFAICLVGGLVWFFFRDVKLALLGVLCSAVPLVLVLGVMTLTGTALTISTSVVFALAFGISIDDTVHVVSGYSQRRAQGDPDALGNTLRETGQALVFSTAALVLGFSVLAISNFPANRTFAWLLSVTLVFALLADLLFLPALLRLVTRRRAPASTQAAAMAAAPIAGSTASSLIVWHSDAETRAAFRSGLADLGAGPPAEVAETFEEFLEALRARAGP